MRYSFPNKLVKLTKLHKLHKIHFIKEEICLFLRCMFCIFFSYVILETTGWGVYVNGELDIVGFKTFMMMIGPWLISDHISRNSQYKDIHMKIMNNLHHICFLEANYY